MDLLSLRTFFFSCVDECTKARIWRDEVGLTGVVVTKLDGTARAGYVVRRFLIRNGD